MDLIGSFLCSNAAPPFILNKDNNRRAIVTLLTTDSFYPGVKALHTSLVNIRCSYPLVVLITADVSSTTRRSIEHYALCKVVEKICIQDNIEHIQASFRNTELTKLNIWNLIEFEKILYIDADCIVLTSIDDLFNIESNFAAAPDVFPPDRFNAGVMVVQPSELIFQDMLSKVPQLVSYDGGDTGFLNAYFPSWFTSTTNKLPFKYNAQRILFWFTYAKNPGYWNVLHPIAILHYSSSPKPWDCPQSRTAASVGGDLEWIWWQVYLGIPIQHNSLV